jgi:hypothetical protein
MTKIHKGEHAEYLDRLSNLEQKRQEMVWLAELWRDYKLKRAKEWYENEKQITEEEYSSEKNGLCEKMITNLQEKKKRLLEDKESFDINLYETEMKGNTRKLRNKKNAFAMSYEYNEKPSNKKGKTTGPVLNYEIPEFDILEDLSVIRRVIQSEMFNLV